MNEKPTTPAMVAAFFQLAGSMLATPAPEVEELEPEADAPEEVELVFLDAEEESVFLDSEEEPDLEEVLLIISEDIDILDIAESATEEVIEPILEPTSEVAPLKPDATSDKAPPTREVAASAIEPAAPATSEIA